MFVCLWKGCKVYNTPSTSQSWLQRHMLSHSGDKPFKVWCPWLMWCSYSTHLGITYRAKTPRMSRGSLLQFCKKKKLAIYYSIPSRHIVCFFFQCVVGGCNATFASQGGLARHVPTHFSSQNSSKLSSQAKLKEESPSKAGISKRRKLKNKCRRSLRTYRCTSDLFF